MLNFPIDHHITALSNANWGPQDALAPKANVPPEHLKLFKSRSISGYLLWMNGPLHWVSKHQSITTRSSAEAEMYAMDECIKALLHINNILEDLGL
eukprot:6067724-Ditylum_brightwellii.AAC.1